MRVTQRILTNMLPSLFIVICATFYIYAAECKQIGVTLYVMISWKLWIYLDHLRWGSEGKYTISDFEWWAILFIAIGARFSVCAPTVDHFISHRVWWFVWLRCASYYNDERSSSRKSQCAKQLYAQVLFYYGDQTLNLTSFVGCTKQLIHQLPQAVDVEIMTEHSMTEMLLSYLQLWRWCFTTGGKLFKLLL